MRKLLSFTAIILVGISLTACSGRNNPVAEGSETEGPDEISPIKKVELPRIITSPDEAGQYLALHYWDNFDFTDTLYIDQPEITEQFFADYVAFIGVLPPQLSSRSVSIVIERAVQEDKMYYYFTELFEKYLDEPNSPLRNEELYISVLESIIANDKVDELNKLRPQAQLNAAYKNRVGSKAADLVLTNEKGNKVRLYDIKSDYILLYFNNPDCNYCEEVTGLIKSSQDMLVPLVKQGVLKIVAVYPDEELEAWHTHVDDMPSDWYRTYDHSLSIRKEQIYDLRAIPSLYLLDKDKTVLLKDLDKVWQIEEFFARNGY